MRGNIIKKRLTSFAFEKTPRISHTCKLVPGQYREYENGLLNVDRMIDTNAAITLLEKRPEKI